MSQSVRERVYYSKLHVYMTPIGRVYNHKQLDLNHSWLGRIEYFVSVMALGNDYEVQRMYGQMSSLHALSHMCVMKYVMTAFCA